MPVKNWADGDYINASDLDDLILTRNLVFANAAARNAFLVGDLAPRPGVITHTLDDGITWHRIMVGGTSYWAPAPGTLIATINLTSQVVIAANQAFTQITQLTTVPAGGRNLNNWWANDKFTPLCPGHYEITYNVCLQNAATDGYRSAGLTFNSATAYANAAACTFIPLISAGPYSFGKSVPMYFNGSTDYSMLAGVSSSTTAHTVIAVSSASQYGCTSLNIKYLGP